MAAHISKERKFDKQLLSQCAAHTTNYVGLSLGYIVVAAGMIGKEINMFSPCTGSSQTAVTCS